MAGPERSADHVQRATGDRLMFFRTNTVMLTKGPELGRALWTAALMPAPAVSA